jgi:lactoylglutathione lyase
MSSWPGGIHVLTLFVEDLETAKRFYRDVFAVSASFEDDESAVFNFGNMLSGGSSEPR